MRKRIVVAFLAVGLLACQNAFISMAEEGDSTATEVVEGEALTENALEDNQEMVQTTTGEEIESASEAAQQRAAQKDEETLQQEAAAATEAARVTVDNPMVKFVPTKQVGKLPPFTDEDYQVIMEAIGADAETSINEGEWLVSADTALTVDWNASTLQMEDIWASDIQGFEFARDESGKLVLARGSYGYRGAYIGSDGNRYVSGNDDWNGWNFFEPTETDGYGYQEKYMFSTGSPGDIVGTAGIINSDIPMPSEKLADLIVIKAWYNPEFYPSYYGGLDWDGGRWNATAFVIDKENMIFNFKSAEDLQILPEVTDNTYVLGGSDGATIACSGEFKDFVDVYVDDVLVDKENYTVAEGSTILTFASKYLNTLSVGTHKVTLNYTYGSIDTQLEILAYGSGSGSGEAGVTDPGSGAEGSTGADATATRTAAVSGARITKKSPQTGDEDRALPWLLLCFAAVCGGTAVSVRKKKTRG